MGSRPLASPSLNNHVLFLILCVLLCMVPLLIVLLRRLLPLCVLTVFAANTSGDQACRADVWHR